MPLSEIEQCRQVCCFPSVENIYGANDVGMVDASSFGFLAHQDIKAWRFHLQIHPTMKFDFIKLLVGPNCTFSSYLMILG